MNILILKQVIGHQKIYAGFYALNIHFIPRAHDCVVGWNEMKCSQMKLPVLEVQLQFFPSCQMSCCSGTSPCRVHPFLRWWWPHRALTQQRMQQTCCCQAETRLSTCPQPDVVFQGSCLLARLCPQEDEGCQGPPRRSDTPFSLTASSAASMWCLNMLTYIIFMASNGMYCQWICQNVPFLWWSGSPL